MRGCERAARASAFLRILSGTVRKQTSMARGTRLHNTKCAMQQQEILSYLTAWDAPRNPEAAKAYAARGGPSKKHARAGSQPPPWTKKAGAHARSLPTGPQKGATPAALAAKLKPHHERSREERKLLVCPNLCNGPSCAFGDKCHYSHDSAVVKDARIRLGINDYRPAACGPLYTTTSTAQTHTPLL